MVKSEREVKTDYHIFQTVEETRTDYWPKRTVNRDNQSEINEYVL